MSSRLPPHSLPERKEALKLAFNGKDDKMVKIFGSKVKRRK
jgi:hypothetical protein